MYKLSEEQLNEADIKLLEQNSRLNECTREERHRFMRGLGIHNLDKVEKELCAYIYFRENDLRMHKEHLITMNPDCDEPFFDDAFCRAVTIIDHKAKDSTKIAYILPAAMKTKDFEYQYRKDMTVGRYHALTLACYLDSLLCRHSFERLTIMLDCRKGEGEHFSNPSVFSIMPVLRDTVKILQSMFQERLSRCIMFPLPSSVMYAWSIIQLLIDKESLARYNLIGGTKSNSAVYSDPPVELKEFVSVETLEKLEKRRRDMFVSN